MTQVWADYTRMTARSAGQYWADGKPAGQWAWSPQPGGDYHISWGDPARWPPPYVEHFHHTGDDEWVTLDGWEDNGTYYTQRVTAEQIGDVNSRKLTTLPLRADHREQYALWQIPDHGYTHKAWGTITEESSGTAFEFGHTQIWYPPARVTNQWIGTQSCIRCWEAWWDSNRTPGQPITRKLERATTYAQGIGPAFTIDQFYPTGWHAELRYHWTW